jgi:hypothetical protein
MAVRDASPFSLPIIDGFAPAGKVAEVCATTGLNQHLGLGAQGEPPEQRHALKVNGKTCFYEIVEDHLQHSVQQRCVGELARGHVP